MPSRRRARLSPINCAPGAKDFGDGPGLSDAASRGKWRVAIKNFSKCSKAIVADVRGERFKVAPGSVPISINAKMSLDKRPEEPAPGCALMIGGIAVAWASGVVALITRLARSEAAQTVGREKLPGANVDDGSLLFRGEGADGERNGENLVWTQ